MSLGIKWHSLIKRSVCLAVHRLLTVHHLVRVSVNLIDCGYGTERLKHGVMLGAQ